MVFSDDLLFIHVPKTAGMAVSDALLRSLPPPVYYAVQEGHAGEDPVLRSRGVRVLEGRRHQRLADADEWFAQSGLAHRVADFRHVLVMVRNPYALEVSRYHYLRKGHPWDAGKAQELAVSGDFAAFVRGSRWWFDFADYYTINGLLPGNLRILRQESFALELASYCRDVGALEPALKSVNESGSGAYATFIDRELELLIFEKYRFLFEKGFYPREIFPDHRGTAG